jgi:hypothetical protein
MILSHRIHVEKIILFFSLPSNSINELVHLSGLRRMTFQHSAWRPGVRATQHFQDEPILVDEARNSHVGSDRVRVDLCCLGLDGLQDALGNLLRCIDGYPAGSCAAAVPA